MQSAIDEAKKCVKDVPVGCVIKKNGKLISSAYNKREILDDVTAHAEILAIQKAQKVLNTSRLDGCEMYVTLEPCPMCAWAIVQSRISTLYFGSYNSQYGAIYSVLNLPELANSKLKVYSGIMEDECDELLNKFFIKIRKNDYKN